MSSAIRPALSGPALPPRPPLAAAPAPARTFALTAMQEGMLANVLSGARGVDLLQVVLTLREPLDAPAFTAAWHGVARRHEAFRLRFRWEGLERPCQEIGDGPSLPIVRLDWPGASDADARLAEFLRTDRERGFELERGVTRVTLVRVSEADWRCVWTAFHGAFDGTALAIVLDELQRTYAALRAGRDPALPPPVPFTRFLAWWHAQDPALSARFWRSQLGDLEAPTPLPIEPEPGGDGYGAAERLLTDVLTADLGAAMRERGLTTGTAVHAAWALCLARHAASDDVVYGGVGSGRRGSAEGAEAAVGMLVATAATRVRPDEEAPRLALLRQVRALRAAMRGHEQAPLALVRSWSGVPAGEPLLSSLVMYDHRDLESELRARDAAWADRSVALHQCTGFPLTLLAYGGSRLRLRLEYRRDRAGDALASRLLAQVEEALRGFAAAPAQPLRTLSLATSAERERAWEEGTGERWLHGHEEERLHDLVRAQARRTPAAAACLGPGGALSYASLEARANRLARVLRRRGVGARDRVGVLVEHSADMAVGALGVLKAGAAFVPLDPSHPPERLEALTREAGLRAGVSHRGHGRAWAAAGLPVVDLDADRGPLELQSAEEPEAPRVGPEDLAYVIFTSGSSGRPKGVMIEHRGAVNTVADVNARLGVSPRDRVLGVSSFTFDLSVWDLFGTLAAGGALVLPGAEALRDARAWLELMRSERVTLWNSVPALMEILLAAAEAGGENLPHLRAVLLSGDWVPVTMPARVRRAAPGAAVLALGGATEASIWSIAFPVGEVPPAWRSVPYGRALRNQSVHVLDAALEPCPVGMPGEIWIGGAGVARGYLGDPERTAAAFVLHPRRGERLYRTGDLGRRLASGDIEFLGRRDQQVKIAGNRIETGEVEAALASHPAVLACAVEAPEQGAGRRRLVAFVVPRDGAHLPDEELRAHLGRTLPAAMLPAAFVTLDALPLSANGKVDRRRLRLSCAATAPPSAATEPPRGATEERLAALWREVLRVSAVGRDGTFAALGGDSLSALQIAARWRGEGRGALRPSDFFDAPTLAQLARRAEERAAGAAVDATFFVGAPPDGACGAGPSRCPFAGGSAREDLDALAARSAEAIRSVRPSGPYRVGGHCYGAVLALAIARRLRRDGEEAVVVEEPGAPALPACAARLGGAARLRFGAERLALMAAEPAVAARWMRERLRPRAARRRARRAGAALAAVAVPGSRPDERCPLALLALVASP